MVSTPSLYIGGVHNSQTIHINLSLSVAWLGKNSGTVHERCNTTNVELQHVIKRQPPAGGYCALLSMLDRHISLCRSLSFSFSKCCSYSRASSSSDCRRRGIISSYSFISLRQNVSQSKQKLSAERKYNDYHIYVTIN